MVWEISDVEEKNGKSVLTAKLDGRFVAAVAPSVREEVMAKMKDGVNVLFDLSQMTHIDSSGLGVLVQILQNAKAHGATVVLSGLQPAPKIVFDITKVSRVFTIVPTMEEAQF